MLSSYVVLDNLQAFCSVLVHVPPLFACFKLCNIQELCLDIYLYHAQHTGPDLGKGYKEAKKPPKTTPPKKRRWEGASSNKVGLTLTDIWVFKALWLLRAELVYLPHGEQMDAVTILPKCLTLFSISLSFIFTLFPLFPHLWVTRKLSLFFRWEKHKAIRDLLRVR